MSTDNELDMAQVTPGIRKMLLIGHEGSGKTHFLGTLPKPLYVFSFDKGYSTLAGIPGITVGIFMDEDRYRPRAWSQFKLKFDEFKKGGMEYTWPDGRKEKYKSVAFDSITACSKCLYDHEQAVNHTIDKQGGFGVWGNVKSKLGDFVTQSVLLAEYAAFTAQVEAEKDDLTGEIFFKPSCEGSFRNEMGQWVDAVFFMQVEKNMKGDKDYRMLTVGDRRQKAKVRVPSQTNQLDAVEVPDFNIIQSKIGGTTSEESNSSTSTTVPSSVPISKPSSTVRG